MDLKIRTKKATGTTMKTVTKTFQDIATSDATLTQTFVLSYLELAEYDTAEAYIVPTPIQIDV